MLKKALMIGAAFFLFLQVGFCYALDWKRLHEKAERENLREALTEVVKNPNSLEALYTLGLVYLNRYKNNEAEQVFRDMLSLDPHSIEAKRGLAEILRRQHKFNESQALLEEVIKADPEFSPAYISLGYMLYDKKDYGKSIRLAQRVIRQSREKVDLTNYTRAYLIIGGAKGMLAGQGGPFSKLFYGTQVLSYFKKAQKLQPDSAGVLLGLGSFYLLAPSIVGGDKNKALDFLEKAIKADPDFADAYARLAQVWRERGDEKKYHAYLSIALELDPQNELALSLKNEKR